jgi:hypothetical protein
MNRRDFLKALSAGIIGAGLAPDVLAEIVKVAPPDSSKNYDDHVKDYLHKMQHFNKPHDDDTYLDLKNFSLLESSVMRLKRLQRFVGHGNFQLLSFDEALTYARNYVQVGTFSREEKDFLEMIFYEEGTFYGFFGEKPQKNLTARIRKREVVKVPGSGNYLYKGKPLEVYNDIREELGDQAILTSGIRSVIKQFLLFLNKTYKSKGNLSLASRSLAPPGYSFHTVGDFDVGQVGLGIYNFTDRFASTEVYRKLKDLGYLKLRYEQNNLLGVRFEPWHIKVI